MRRALPTSPEHARNLDRLRDRYGRTEGPVTIPRTGRLIVFADGCASWLTYPTGFVGLDPERVLAELVNDPVVGGMWDGSHIATYLRPDGPGGPTFDVELGISLPSYHSCPRHCEGGTDRPIPGGFTLTEESAR